MQEIDIAKEIVENHSTEEVLAWIEKEAKRLMHYAAKGEIPEGFRLGMVVLKAQELYSVASALNNKLYPDREDEPVAA